TSGSLRSSFSRSINASWFNRDLLLARERPHLPASGGQTVVQSGRKDQRDAITRDHALISPSLDRRCTGGGSPGSTAQTAFTNSARFSGSPIRNRPSISSSIPVLVRPTNTRN